MDRGGQKKAKDDGSKLPKRPPNTLATDLERKAYRRICSALERAPYATGADIEAVVLAAQRLAHVEELRSIKAGIPRDGWYTRGGNGQMCAHPVFVQLARAERDWASSQRALLLTIAGRSSTRLSAEDMEQKHSGPRTKEEREADEDLR